MDCVDGLKSKLFIKKARKCRAFCFTAIAELILFLS